MLSGEIADSRYTNKARERPRKLAGAGAGTSLTGCNTATRLNTPCHTGSAYQQRNNVIGINMEALGNEQGKALRRISRIQRLAKRIHWPATFDAKNSCREGTSPEAPSNHSNKYCRFCTAELHICKLESTQSSSPPSPPSPPPPPSPPQSASATHSTLVGSSCASFCYDPPLSTMKRGRPSHERTRAQAHPERMKGIG